jgi:hypothetical protein
VISSETGSLTLSLLLHSERIDEPNPCFDFHSRDIMQISNALSPRLAVVEELLLDSFHIFFSPPASLWRRFLVLFHNVKVLRLQHSVMFVIARSLRLNQGQSAPVLPSLEEIVLYAPMGYATRDEHRSDAIEAFEPSIAALRRAGRPVKIVCREVEKMTFSYQDDCLTPISECVGIRSDAIRH